MSAGRIRQDPIGSGIGFNDLGSPKGGKAPLDPSSLEKYKDDNECKQLLSDEKAKEGYENTIKLSDCNANDYVALLFVGGYAPCFDLPHDKDNIKLAEEFWKQGKIVSAICHGPAALGLFYLF